MLPALAEDGTPWSSRLRRRGRRLQGHYPERAGAERGLDCRQWLLRELRRGAPDRLCGQLAGGRPPLCRLRLGTRTQGPRGGSFILIPLPVGEGLRLAERSDAA